MSAHAQAQSQSQAQAPTNARSADAKQRQGMVGTSQVPVGLDGAKEELGAVGVGASVGHGEDAGALVLELAANEQRHANMSAALPPFPSPPHHRHSAPTASMNVGGAARVTHKFSSSNLAP